jgi:pullulanase
MRKFLAGLLALLTAVLTASPSAVALPESTELTIHYHRFDADYKDWNLWLWPKGGNGAAYSFTEDDSFGKVAKVKVRIAMAATVQWLSANKVCISPISD